MDRYEEFLKRRLARAEKSLEKYRLKNLRDDAGHLPDDYCDADWSRWHAADAEVAAYADALVVYTTFIKSK